MIRDLQFGEPDDGGVRRARYVARASIPLGAACTVAGGVREALHELLGRPCDVNLGEPAAVEAEVWRTLAADACCFVTTGRQTDVVLAIAADDARRLVAAALGEPDPAAPLVRGATAELSALELHALERIAARCAAAFDPLYAERRGATQRVPLAAIPACVEYFDVRVRSPLVLDLGIGIVRRLPDPGPSTSFPAGALRRIPVELRVDVGHAILTARELIELAPGAVLTLQSQVGTAACLKIADTQVASGIGGVTNGRYGLELRTMLWTGA